MVADSNGLLSWSQVLLYHTDKDTTRILAVSLRQWPSSRNNTAFQKVKLVFWWYWYFGIGIVVGIFWLVFFGGLVFLPNT